MYSYLHSICIVLGIISNLEVILQCTGVWMLLGFTQILHLRILHISVSNKSQLSPVHHKGVTAGNLEEFEIRNYPSLSQRV